MQTAGTGRPALSERGTTQQQVRPTARRLLPTALHRG